MKELVNRLGQALSHSLGSPILGTRSSLRYKESVHEQIFHYDHLLSTLGYEYVEKCTESGREYTLFISRQSVGFTIECAPFVGGTKDTHKTIQELLEELLEEGVSIQCLLLADHKINDTLKSQAKQRASQGPLFFEMVKQRALHFRDLPTHSIRNFRCLLSISMPGAPSASLYKKLIDKQKRVLKTLQELSYAFAWDEDTFLTTTASLVNFHPSTIPDTRNFTPLQTLASQLPNGGKLTVKEEGIVWERKKPTQLKTYRAVDFPDHWSIHQMHNLLGAFEKNSFHINAPFYIHYGIYCPPQASMERSYTMRSSIVEKQGRSSFLCRMIPGLVDEVQDIDHIRNRRKRGDLFVYTQLSTGFWSQSGQTESVEQTLKSLWKMNDFKLQENRYIHLPSFLSILPMSWGECATDLKDLGVLRTTISSETVNLMPMAGEWRGTPTPGVLLTGRRGQLSNFNIFDGTTNYNAVVVGESGSGKSVFMQEILLNNLGTGGKVYVLDVGGSFEKLCEVVSGQKIQCTEEEKLCLNPFTHISPTELSTYVGALKSILATMAHPTQGASDLENALLEEAILHVWEEKRNQATITDIAHFLYAQEQEEAHDLATMLGPFTKTGNYASYFEGDANINFHKKMVLIELEELKNVPELQAVVLQIFILEINRQIFLGDRKTPTIICIDEAWDLLRAKQTGPFIETLARRLRKYNGSLIVGTQSVEDFYQSQGAMAAYDNSCWTCLLSQKPESILAYAKKSNCPPEQIQVLQTVRKKSGEYSEIMIQSENGYSVSRLILDPFSQLLYSTSAEDRKQIEPYRKQGMPVHEAIRHVLKKNR